MSSAAVPPPLIGQRKLRTTQLGSLSDHESGSPAFNAHLIAVCTNAMELMRAAAQSDDLLQIVLTSKTSSQLSNNTSGPVLDIDPFEIARRTRDHGNPRMSALVDLMLVFSALKSKHHVAYQAVINRLRLLVEPDYWDELLD